MTLFGRLSFFNVLFFLILLVFTQGLAFAQENKNLPSKENPPADQNMDQTLMLENHHPALCLRAKGGGGKDYSGLDP